jgi:protein TonB
MVHRFEFAFVGSTRGRRSFTFPLSMLLHSLAAVLLVTLPLLGTDALPEPAQRGVPAFLVPAAPSAPPAPPAAAPARARPARAQPRHRPARKAALVAPVEIPRAEPSPEILPLEAQPFTGVDALALTDGLAGGVEGGVPAGVEGGVPGGVEGGVPGGVLGGVAGGDETAPVPSPPPAPVRVGGDVKEPVKLRHVAPEYPALARAAQVQGMVILEATIGTDGRVSDVKVLRANPFLERAAVTAVRQWVYSPTLLNGQPVPVIMTVTVNFKLS